MFTVIALARRNPELSQQAFEQRWVHDHAVGTNYDGLISYRIGITRGGAEGAPCDGIALMTFTDKEAFAVAGDSPVGREKRRDAESFCSTLDFFLVDFHDIELAV